VSEDYILINEEDIAESRVIMAAKAAREAFGS